MLSGVGSVARPRLTSSENGRSLKLDTDGKEIELAITLTPIGREGVLLGIEGGSGFPSSDWKPASLFRRHHVTLGSACCRAASAARMRVRSFRSVA